MPSESAATKSPRCLRPWCGVGGKFCVDCTHEAARLLTAIEEATRDRPPTTNQMPVEMWTYVAMSDDVPTALRMLADRLEETGQALLGLQSTGFGEPWEAVIQVFVDPDRDEPKAASDG